jgi:hypothetical protein
LNIKRFNFFLLALISLLFGSTCFGIVKADIKYTTVETLEDYCCIDDSYVNNSMPNTNYGDLESWHVEYSTSDWVLSYFKFNLTNKPNDIINSEVILTGYLNILIFPLFNSDNSWTEENITWNNQPIPSPTYLPFEIVIEDVYGYEYECHINISNYLSSEIISVVLINPIMSDGYAIGHSKESIDTESRPKILWTYEEEHVIEETYDLMGDIIVGSIGFGIGFIVTSALFIGLRRRKK